MRLQHDIQLAKPVAPAVDVDDVHVVQQAVEDRSGQDLVAREDLRPVPDVLVRGQHDRATLVTRGHEAEEEVRLVSVQRPEADFVDDQERCVEIALGFEPGRRDRRIGSQHVHQVIQHVVLRAEAVLRRLRLDLPAAGGPLQAGSARDVRVRAGP